ncbi:methyltransferase domain-containing protein [Colletotrichum kahawae]|uniref:Methyltransferase domain-containing protein n=1 Tax=Colletotrichum kahawae TaxID=34407 RepID=A0AAD9YG11_COLKA|nr:methyltransferase domain-containing protein [Colletotrichum kahawae]
MEPPARPFEKLTPIEDDHIMELICLFNDARDVRNFLKHTWTRLVTQAAFQHLTDLELDFSRGYRFGFFDIMFGTLYTFCALGEAKQWLVMPTETEAKAFAYDNIQRIIRSGWIPTPEIDEWLMSDTLGMLDSIAEVLSTGSQPTEDALRPVLAKSSTSAEHFLPNTRRLAQLHMESKAVQPAFARLDLLATRLRESIQRTRIRMSTAVMCRTFLDLYTISGLHSRFESDLNQLMRHRSIQRLIEIEKSSAIRDSLIKAHLDALFLPTNPGQKKASVRSPFFLGSVLSSLILKLNSSELSLQDLDFLIELQKEPIFAPEPPTELSQCVSRFWIAQGLKPSEILSVRDTSGRLALCSVRKHPTELYEKRLEHFKKNSGARRDLRALAEGLNPLKNSLGKRRELQLAPLLQHIHWMRCITGGWRLSMGEKTVRGAVETDLGKRLGRGQSPPLASDLPVVVWLGQLEKMIQAETPGLFFGFTELEEIVVDSLGFLASTGALARAFEQPERALASWKESMPSDKSLLESEHVRWLDWCK